MSPALGCWVWTGAEASCIGVGGTVVRLAGLYSVERGPHNFWLGKDEVSGAMSITPANRLGRSRGAAIGCKGGEVVGSQEEMRGVGFDEGNGGARASSLC